MAAGTGKARKIIKAIPLAVMDVVAVVAAWIISTWGEVLDAQLATSATGNLFAVFIRLRKPQAPPVVQAPVPPLWSL